MSTENQDSVISMNTILVPIDVSREEAARETVQTAQQLAGFYKAEMHFLSVMPGFGSPLVASYFTEEQADLAARDFAQSLRSFLQGEGLAKHDHSIAMGKPWEEIVRAAEKIPADLIVLHHHARHRPGGSTLIGSCSQQVMERSPCSVFLIR